jgi:RNA polymerase sigma-70 factor (ECF subfamily)
MLTADAYPDWEAVYRDNLEPIYRLMFAKVGNRADAEDLTAEVFLAALGPLRVSATVGEVRAYLLATARTVLAAHWRRHYGAQITTITEATDALAWVPAAAEQIGARTASSVAAAERLLAALPEQYRQVLRLRFLDGLSVRETAATMGVSVGNAKVLQHRALRRAGQLIDEVDR